MKLKPFKEIQDVLLPLSQDDYNRLKESIKKKGIQIPILKLEDGRIVDGFHRQKIAEELGITDIPCEIKQISEKEALMLALSLNLARRHLSYDQKKELMQKLRKMGMTQEKVAEVIGVTRQRVDQMEDISNANISNTYIPDLRYSIPKKMQEEIAERAREETQEQIASDYGISQPRVSQIIKKVEARKKVPEPVGELTEPKEKYFKTIIIDPPWPIKKIERDVAPNQGLYLDYPTMTIEEIKKLPVSNWKEESGCHIYLWTTQKFLPFAFEILEEWGLNYIFTMVWHKKGGFQPFNLPQYNCEFILFGRWGNLDFLTTKKFFTCFEGSRREHSRKPDEFYKMVEKVSPEPRLDVFSREKRDGFEQYGNEITKFT